jgi:hypothetical protein
MSLFEIVGSELTEHAPAHFADLGLYERGDLQRLVRDQIGVIGDDLLVVEEEFGEWEDARRRIDLLALDRAGHPTVIELKRTDDGGHMELQALRYAAMVSSMDFDDFVTAFARFSARQELDGVANAAPTTARTALVEFLGGVEGDEPIISSEVRIILVSANFGRELTTTVLWLNRFECLDIRCVQLIPYRVGERVLIDVRQLVPLPEASDYQVRVRRKEQQRERVQRDGRDFTRYHVIIDGEERPQANKRTAMRLFVTSLVERGVALESIKQQLHPRCLRSVEGRYHDAEAVKAAFLKADPKIDIPRWWYEHPLVEDDRTWILTRMWGTDTEPSLAALAKAFPQTGVTYRAA